MPAVANQTFEREIKFANICLARYVKKEKMSKIQAP
jgi:hypothetical protein